MCPLIRQPFRIGPRAGGTQALLHSGSARTAMSAAVTRRAGSASDRGAAHSARGGEPQHRFREALSRGRASLAEGIVTAFAELGARDPLGLTGRIGRAATEVREGTRGRLPSPGP